MFDASGDRPDTPAEQQRLRHRHGLDRRALKQVAIAMTIIFGGISLLAAAEIAGVDRRMTTATVVGLANRSGPRRSPECVTELSTGFGYARIFTSLPCEYAKWHIGDHAEVEARQLRLSQTISVNTHGTIFEGARSLLPES